MAVDNPYKGRLLDRLLIGNEGLDDAARLEELPAVTEAFGFAAGYNLQLWPFLQNLGQLREVYKDAWSSVLANCGLVQFFTPVDMTKAEFIQKRGGSMTGTSLSRSYASGLMRGPRGESYNDARMPLLPPERTMSQAQDQSIVFFAGKHDPLLVGRTSYWNIPRLKGQFEVDPFHTRP